jgi:NAD(P)-dependent dehydrogenase (short-subunit alcohol dehydrogenase family)
MNELAGKVALVTGGSRGIGAAITRRLAQAGAAVAFTYVSAADKAQEVAKQIDADGGTVLAQADRLWAVDVRAVFVATQAAARHLPEGGRIITVGSALAERVPVPGMTLYSMAKSALTGLTRGLARDLGPGPSCTWPATAAATSPAPRSRWTAGSPPDRGPRARSGDRNLGPRPPPQLQTRAVPSRP